MLTSTLRKSKELRQVLLERIKGIKMKDCYGETDGEGMVGSKSSSREWFNGNADST